MLHYINTFYHQVLHYADRLSPSQWVMLLVVMLFLGVLCLRGFGSRTNY